MLQEVYFWFLTSNDSPDDFASTGRVTGTAYFFVAEVSTAAAFGSTK